MKEFILSKEKRFFKSHAFTFKHKIKLYNGLDVRNMMRIIMDYTTLEFLDTRTDGQTDGWTDRRGSQNSYLDILAVAASICSSALPCPARH